MYLHVNLNLDNSTHLYYSSGVSAGGSTKGNCGRSQVSLTSSIISTINHFDFNHWKVYLNSMTIPCKPRIRRFLRTELSSSQLDLLSSRSEVSVGFLFLFLELFALVVEGWGWIFISRSRPDRMFWPVWILGGRPASRASAVQVSQFNRNHRHHHHHNCNQHSNHHQRWCIALMEHPVIQKCQSVEKLESFKSIFLQRRSIFILWYMESWILLALGWN